jgi:hypothetical protein
LLWLAVCKKIVDRAVKGVGSDGDVVVVVDCE